jgi:hypothetical protein
MRQEAVTLIAVVFAGTVAAAGVLMAAGCGESNPATPTASPKSPSYQGRTPVVGTVTVTSQAAKPGGEETKVGDVRQARGYWWGYEQEK